MTCLSSIQHGCQMCQKRSLYGFPRHHKCDKCRVLVDSDAHSLSFTTFGNTDPNRFKITLISVISFDWNDCFHYKTISLSSYVESLSDCLSTRPWIYHCFWLVRAFNGSNLRVACFDKDFKFALSRTACTRSFIFCTAITLFVVYPFLSWLTVLTLFQGLRSTGAE